MVLDARMLFATLRLLLNVALFPTVNVAAEPNVRLPLNVAIELTVRFDPLMTVVLERKYDALLEKTTFADEELMVRFAPKTAVPVRVIPVAFAKNFPPAIVRLLVVSTVFPIANVPIAAPFAASDTTIDPLLMRSIIAFVRASQSRKVFAVLRDAIGSVGVGIGAYI